MNFRQFKYLRMRMLLRKQFEIERLQDALHVLDQQDDKDNPLWLISQQLDANEKRKEVFAQLDTTLLAYGLSPLTFVASRTQKF